MTRRDAAMPPRRGRLLPARSCGLMALATVLVLGGAAPPSTAAETWSAVDSLVYEARVAAGEDRHDDSIALYREALEKDPSARERLSLDLARQLTWAERLDESVEELAWYLGERPDDTEARLHLALTYSWDGRLRDALSEYRTVLSTDPHNTDGLVGEARMLLWQGHFNDAESKYQDILVEHGDALHAQLGLAQVTNWKGESRRAWKMYAMIAESSPRSPEAREGLAAAQNWVGRPDLALTTLWQMEDQGLATPTSRKMERDIKRELAPHAGTFLDTFDDSQDYRLRAVKQEVSFHPTPLMSVSPWLSWKEEERPDEFDTSEFWLGVKSDWRLSTGLSASADLGVLPSPDPDTDYVPITAHGVIGIQPSDGTRFDFVYDHRLFTLLNRAAPAPRVDKLVGNTYGLNLMQKFDYKTTLTGSYDYSTYDLEGDDDIHFRHNGSVRLKREILMGPPKVTIEGGYQLIDFNSYANIGVWTPDRFQSLQLGLGLEWKPRRNWFLAGGLQGAIQKEEQRNSLGDLEGEWDEAAGFTTFVATTQGRVHAYLGGGYADSSFDTGRGYSRTYAFLGVTFGIY